MSGTKRTAIIVGSVAGGVVGGYILLTFGKMAWDRYTKALDTHKKLNVQSVSNQNRYSANIHYDPEFGGSSQKSKKHKRHTRRHHRK